jgi:hypothetical protein
MTSVLRRRRLPSQVRFNVAGLPSITRRVPDSDATPWIPHLLANMNCERNGESVRPTNSSFTPNP